MQNLDQTNSPLTWNFGLPWGLENQGGSNKNDLAQWPKISIVTPSFNQGEFLEATIKSVLLQGYPNLEYIIIDGGSSDSSKEIIQKYEKYLSFWVSEKDNGMYHAINKGFLRATGEILAWINSSDMLCPWAFWVVAQIFYQNPDIEWLSSLFPIRWAANGMIVNCQSSKGFNKDLFYLERCHMQQESIFWRKELWNRTGAGIDERFSYAGDVELWARFFEQAELYGVNVPLGGSRYHKNKISSSSAYFQEYQRVLKKYKPGAKEKVRAILRSFKVNEVPKVRVLIHKLFGYDLPLIIGKEAKGKIVWKAEIQRQLL